MTRVPTRPALLKPLGPVRTPKRWHRVVVLSLVVVVLAAGAFVGFQLTRGVPSPAVRSAVPVSVQVPGAPPALPWPAKGEAVVGLVGQGALGSAGGNAPVPIASVTKIMTALVILRDHPMGPADPGPPVAITPADVNQYTAAVAGKESAVKVAPGEMITERQMLDGLLVGSADNISSVLANWDAGSEPALLAKMNAAAAALGMGATHYVDLNGLNAATVSTASDQLTLAQAAMAVPAFAAIVRQPEVTLPVAGRVFNFNRLAGKDGIIGVKTGNTMAAGSCWLFAADRVVAGQHVTVLGVVLGQPGPAAPQPALDSGKALLDAAGAALASVTVVPAGQPAARVTAPWVSGAVPASTGAAVSFLGWPGMQVQTQFQPRQLGSSFPAGTVVGTLTVRAAGQSHQVPVKATSGLSGPSLQWRLRHV
jgi:D-alanyl-D-alanine carboxypeptidase (penicillin-binding protein 5/6)